VIWKCYTKDIVEVGKHRWNDTRPRDMRPIIIYLILSVILSGKRAFERKQHGRTAEGPTGSGEGEKSRDYHGTIGRGRIGASESRHSRETVFEGRLAIDQMESLANQLGAPTAARKRLQIDLLPRLSGYSAERQREIA